jgi:hypothetical protein
MYVYNFDKYTKKKPKTKKQSTKSFVSGSVVKFW